MATGGGFNFPPASSAPTSSQSTQPAAGGFKFGGGGGMFGDASKISAGGSGFNLTGNLFGASGVSTAPSAGSALSTPSSGTATPAAMSAGLFGSLTSTPASTAPNIGFQMPGSKLGGRLGMPPSNAVAGLGGTAGPPAAASTSAQSTTGGLPSFQQATSNKQTAPNISLQTTTSAVKTQPPAAQTSLFTAKLGATATTSGGLSNLLTSTTQQQQQQQQPQQPQQSATTTLAATTAVTTAAPVTSSSKSAASADKNANKMSYKELEDQMNKWYSELENQERKFLEQAMKVNAWDRDLIENGEKITDLNNQVENVKKDQSRLTSELDFITSQQKELEEMLIPLEQSVNKLPSINSQQHVDSEREHTYQMAENIDGQLKRMTEDLKELIDHLNTTSNSKQNIDPLMAVSKILNAHMDSLQWIEQNTVALQTKTQAIASHSEMMKKEHERNLRLAYS